MKKQVLTLVAMLTLTFSVVRAQTQTQSGDKRIQSATHTTRKKEAVTALSSPVLGGGTLGRLTKWTGFNSSSFIGDSIITETKDGNIGIGTVTPTSMLTVAGTIETTLGGYKFPDGTVQTTAGLVSVFHDASLIGNGASGSPLGIALGGVNTSHLANGAVTGLKIANGSVVRSLNGLLDNVNLAAGPNVTVTPAGNTLTIAAPNLLSSVARDATLTGNGTTGSPLGVSSQGIGTAQLANSAVTTNQLADNAVTGAKIAPGQVGNSQLADNAVTAAKIAPGQVGNSQLADNAVTSAKLAPGQVVKTLNGITDNVFLTTDTNLTITPASNSLTIAAPNMLTSIAHDASLTGAGTSVSPLSVVVGPATSQQPVAFRASFQLDNGVPECQVNCAAVYTVPQGQRLVIQQLMATVENDNPTQHESAFLTIDSGIQGGEFFLPIILTEQTHYLFAPPGTSSFAGSQQVTIYLNAGETVEFGGTRTNTSGNSFFFVNFYGYLVPAP